MASENSLIHYLSVRYLTGELTPAEAEQLLKLVKTDNQNSDVFFSNVLTDFYLSENANHSTSLIPDAIPSDSPVLQKIIAPSLPFDYSDWNQLVEYEKHVPPLHTPQLEEETPPKRGLHFWASRGIVAAAALCFLTYIVWISAVAMKRDLFGDHPVAQTNSATRITEIIDVVWAEDADIYNRGQEIQTGKIHLLSGLVKIKFINDTEVILEGPTEFIINDPMKTYCNAGKVSVHVGPSASGFEIASPFATVVDRGTEFFLSVDKKESIVNVVKGQVDFGLPRKDFVSLTEGDACKMDESQRTERISFNLDQFCGSKKFEDLLLKYVFREKEKRLQTTSVWDNNSDLLARFDFDEVLNKKTVNRSVSGKRLCPDMILSGISQTEGSLYGTEAIHFKNSQSHGSFTLPGSFESMTFAVNVQIDQLRNLTNTFFTSNRIYRDKGTVMWQVSRMGNIVFYISQGEGKQDQVFGTEVVLSRKKWGGWYRFAVVADAKKKTISHYLDGKLLVTLPWEKPVPLTIGEATFANCLDKNTSSNNRSLKGTFDNFMIFKRALSAQEIREL